jgi:hypothetical protein
VLAQSHLVVARAGASTIAELTVAGRPAILVPLPSAMDDHQTANALEMAVEGGAKAIPQPQFTPERLASEIIALATDPEALIAAAAHAKKCGHPNATEDLADLIESFGRTPVMDAVGDLERGNAKVKPGLAPGAAAREILPGTGRGAECVAMPGAWRKRVAGCVAAVGRSMVEGVCRKHTAQPQSPSTIPAGWSPSRFRGGVA